MKIPSGQWVETIGYGHHAASGAVYTQTTRDMRDGKLAEEQVTTALTNESAKTALRHWYTARGYLRVTVLESEYPGSFIVKGISA